MSNEHNDNMNVFGATGVSESENNQNSTVNNNGNEKCWERFIELTKKWEKPKDLCCRQVYIDNELHETLTELDFPEMRIGDKLNMMLRSFMETYIEELKVFRKKKSKSIFDK